MEPKQRSIPLPILYDQLYDEGQKVLDKYNPCDVQGGLCLAARKLGVRDPNSNRNFCCSGCEHLGPDGCTVEALSCKLWLCPTLHEGRPEVANEMRTLVTKGRRVGMPLYEEYYVGDFLLRKSKEQTLEYMRTRECQDTTRV